MLAMQLMRLADMPSNPRDRVFDCSRLRADIGAAVFAAVTIGAFIFARIHGIWRAYYMGAIILSRRRRTGSLRVVSRGNR